MDEMKLLHGNVQLPAFFPDGTYGVVRSVDAGDLYSCEIPGVVMNSYHLMSKPGISTIKSIDGIHNFVRWNKPILTDSGGFQVFSLIRENSKFGEIRKNEIVFRPSKEKKVLFTPQKCIRLQINCGSDILMCLDYCTHPDDPIEVNKLSVDTTIRWARMCKEEYNKLTKNKYEISENKPLLFAIIQGGNDKKLRQVCAEALIDIGFDGFGFGGWPLNNKGEFIEDILSYTAELMPDNTPKYAMGIGRPEEIVKCVKMGYNLFDCVIPTREARHHRLYVFNYDNIEDINLEDKAFYRFVYILDEKYIKDDKPISEICDCYSCKNYSKAYLRHLFKIGDTLAYRLATIHNLRFYTNLMSYIRDRQKRR